MTPSELSFVSLGLAMPSLQNPFVVFCVVFFIAEGVWLFGLWCLALARLRHRSLYLVVIAAFLSASTSAMQFVMYYQLPWLLGFLGKQGYAVFYYAFSGMQLVEALLTVVGFTLFVFWLCKTHPVIHASRPNQSVEPL